MEQQLESVLRNRNRYLSPIDLLSCTVYLWLFFRDFDIFPVRCMCVFRYLNFFLRIFIVSLIAFTYGSSGGWIAPALAIMKGEDSPIREGQLSNEHLSWLGSINSLGSVCGNVLFAYLAACVGCKRAIHLVSIPAILCWLLTMGNSYYSILLARFFCGINGGGVHVALALFIADIADKE